MIKLNPQLKESIESFDISGKVDTNNPIYKFYEKDVQKYLNKFGGKKIVDPQGVSWIEVSIKKEQGKLPIEAFGAAALPFAIQDKNDPNEMSVERIKNEIAFRESGIANNPYNAIRKNSTSTDYGKYQVNTDTLKTYSQKFLGKQVTPEEFLSNPDLQEEFMDRAVKHLEGLGAKSLDSFLVLWHKGWGDVSSSRVRRLKSDPGVVQYINNVRFPKSQQLFVNN